MGANLWTLIFVSVDLWNYASRRWPQSGQANAQQFALSVFWAVYALAGISVGIWQRSRTVRLFAMGLLYLSIFKAFLFELNGLQGIYRIVSFFIPGIILLAVSLLYTRFEERMRPATTLRPIHPEITVYLYRRKRKVSANLRCEDRVNVS